MKKYQNHQRPRRKYRFDIVGHKKAFKIWWDSTIKYIVEFDFIFAKKLAYESGAR